MDKKHHEDMTANLILLGKHVVRNVGTFYLRRYKAKKSNLVGHVPERTVVRFKPSGKLKSAVRNVPVDNFLAK